LRYYFAAKSSAGVDDLDLNFDDYTARVNADLVGKFVNIASRCAKLLETNFDNNLGPAYWSTNCNEIPSAPDAEWVKAAKQVVSHVTSNLQNSVAKYYEEGNFNKAIVAIMTAADIANEYIAGSAPWNIAKDPSRKEELHLVLTTGINLFAILARALKPALPSLVRQSEEYLGLMENGFNNLDFLDANHHLQLRKVNSYSPLITRIDPKNIAAMIEASKDSLAPTETTASPAKKVAAKAAPTITTSPMQSAPSPQPQAPSDYIGIDDFAKLDLRIGKVLECDFVEGSDKLLRFKLDAGDLGERQIFSGIRAAYPEPQILIGRNVIFIANLAPRKMRFGVSEGMILSAGNDNDGWCLLDVDTGCKAGMPVK
jgi:methionyl-tRNA synthetase